MGGEQINEELERQEDQLGKQLNNGEISQAEYNQSMRELQREAREELQNQ